MLTTLTIYPGVQDIPRLFYIVLVTAFTVGVPKWNIDEDSLWTLRDNKAVKGYSFFAFHQLAGSFLSFQKQALIATFH